MYLSQLRLDPASASARRDLASPYELHRTLTRAFATTPDRPPPRFLWRLEPGRIGDPNGVLLVQSQQPGQWGWLRAIEGYLAREVAQKAVDEEALLARGPRFRFRLRANPVVTRQGKRIGLAGADAQCDWLRRQGKRLGFDVRSADVTARQRIAMRQRRDGEGITLDTVLFDGVLEVRDGAAVRHALLGGVGPGKAMGMGMLSLAPARF